MQDFIFKYKGQIALIITALFVIGFGWLIYYSFFVFHATSVSPSGQVVSPLVTRFTVNFNKELSDKDFSVSADDLIISSDVNDKSLIIDLSQGLSPQTEYTFTISNLSSKNGDTIKKYSFSIKTGDVSRNLSDQEIEDSIDQQEENKSALLKDPIYNNLPHYTDTYYIDGTVNEDTQSVGVEVTIFLTKDSLPNRDAFIESAKGAALEYLKSLKDIDISKYPINYVVQDP